jgi:putative ATPase
MELFEEPESKSGEKPGGQAKPLAVRMRPRTREEFVGQEHFFAPGKLLRRMLEADRLMSVIFYGPPGTGKTTLAHVIAEHSRAAFHTLNAAASGVAELRDGVARAQDRLRMHARRTVLFIDELHRFNKAQQDVLLPDVEEGTVIMVGATTQVVRGTPYSICSSGSMPLSSFEFLPELPRRENLEDLNTAQAQ